MIGRTNRLRASLIAGFIASFLIIASVFFILRSQGKRFTNGGEIVSSSVIRVNSIPKDVRAYVNGVEVKINDKLIQNVEIGNVEVILEKEGYSTWSKTIEVKAGNVADIFAQLYPVELSSTQVGTQPIDKIVYQDDTSHAYYSVLNSSVDGEIGLWKYKLAVGTLDLNRDPKPEMFATLENDLIESIKDSSYSMTISPDANKLMIKVAEPKKVFLIDTDKGEVTDLQDLLGYIPENVIWGTSENELLMRSKGVVTLFNTNDNRKTVVLQNQDLSSVFCSAKSVYYALNTNLGIVERIKDGKTETLSEIPQETLSIDQAAKISCSKEDDIFVLSTAEGLFYVDTGEDIFSKVSNTGSVTALAQDGLSFIYESDGELYSGSINPKETDINLQIKRINLVIDESVLSVKYSNNSEKLIINTRDGYEIRDFDGQNPTSLFETQTFLNGSLGFSEDSKSAFIALNSAVEDEPMDVFTLYKVDLND